MIDECMKKAAEWCVAFRNLIEGDGDVATADSARDALRFAINAAILAEREACAMVMESEPFHSKVAADAIRERSNRQ